MFVLFWLPVFITGISYPTNWIIVSTKYSSDFVSFTIKIFPISAPTIIFIFLSMAQVCRSSNFLCRVASLGCQNPLTMIGLSLRFASDYDPWSVSSIWVLLIQNICDIRDEKVAIGCHSYTFDHIFLPKLLVRILSWVITFDTKQTMETSVYVSVTGYHGNGVCQTVRCHSNIGCLDSEDMSWIQCNNVVVVTTDLCHGHVMVMSLSKAILALWL